MGEVGEEHDDRKDVEAGNPEVAESGNDHFVDIECFDSGKCACGECVREVSRVKSHADGVLKEVIDEEDENRQAREDHVTSGDGRRDRVAELVALVTACRLVFEFQLNGQDDVNQEYDTKTDADAPQCCGRHGVQAVCIGVNEAGVSVNEKVTK